jgi:negative regulator of sigma E activity
MNDAIKTQISAFVDGELPDNESEMLLRRLSQDLELRQQAAEYFAIGRAMKGHRDVKGIATLRERIAAQIGDTEFSETSVRAEPAGSRYTRPLAGAAIAATVALADATYTVPVQADEQLLQYRLLHNASTGNINARLVTLQLREGGITEPGLENPANDGSSTDDEEAQDQQTQ